MSKFIIFSFFLGFVLLIVIVCICAYMCHGASAGSQRATLGSGPSYLHTEDDLELLISGLCCECFSHCAIYVKQSPCLKA